MEELPVVFLDHMTDEQRRAYTLVDNQLTLNSGFDVEILESELSEILTIDMSQFDLEVHIPEPVEYEEVQRMNMSGPDGPVEEHDDGHEGDDLQEQQDVIEGPEGEAETSVRFGDTWEIGKSQVCCSDKMRHVSDADILVCVFTRNMNGATDDICDQITNAAAMAGKINIVTHVVFVDERDCERAVSRLESITGTMAELVHRVE